MYIIYIIFLVSVGGYFFIFTFSHLFFVSFFRKYSFLSLRVFFFLYTCVRSPFFYVAIFHSHILPFAHLLFPHFSNKQTKLIKKYMHLI